MELGGVGEGVELELKESEIFCTHKKVNKYFFLAIFKEMFHSGNAKTSHFNILKCLGF